MLSTAPALSTKLPHGWQCLHSAFILNAHTGSIQRPLGHSSASLYIRGADRWFVLRSGPEVLQWEEGPRPCGVGHLLVLHLAPGASQVCFQTLPPVWHYFHPGALAAEVSKCSCFKHSFPHLPRFGVRVASAFEMDSDAPQNFNL